jgi:hypothetical protein
VSQFERVGTLTAEHFADQTSFFGIILDQQNCLRRSLAQSVHQCGAPRFGSSDEQKIPLAL